MMPLVGILTSVAFGWPLPPNGGDPTIPGEALDASSLNTSVFNDAVEVIRESNPTLATEISTSRSNGSIGYISIGSPPEDVAGMADSNTIAVAEEFQDDPDLVATILVHEYRHVRQFNDSPDTTGEDDLPVNCQESFAYAEQLAYMYSLMNARQNQEPLSGTRPYTCAFVKATLKQLEARIAVCIYLENGQPASVPGPASTYCEE
jgi:hypothetical protein